MTVCPYCDTSSEDALGPDDCCHGAEAAALRAERDRYRDALSKIAGEWHARDHDGERYGCSCPEFAREALSQ